MNVLKLTSSRFFGGPERQMLGLATSGRGLFDTTFASFAEGGRCADFLNRATAQGFKAIELENDTPRLLGARNELVHILRDSKIDVLICQGYKAGIIGWFAARKAGIPIVAVSRGWTGECFRVKLYEQLDRWILKRMDRVVCVSSAQASKVRAVGVRQERIEVIRNSVDIRRFDNPDPAWRTRLLELFPSDIRSDIRFVIGSAGRLSPEKGFDVLASAAETVIGKRDDVGFVLFGDGPMREQLLAMARRSGTQHRFVIAGFSSDLDCYFPHFDLFVQSSRTEGLPNVILESVAAGVPVVATDVGGTSEIVREDRGGVLVPPDDSAVLADTIGDALENPVRMGQLASAGRDWVNREFSFASQADAYRHLLSRLAGSTSTKCTN